MDGNLYADAVAAQSAFQPGAAEAVDALPSGVVTLLFTDIEGSTQLLKRAGDAYVDLLERHRALIRAAIATEGGIEVGTEGDSFFVAFRSAGAGVAAALAAQRVLTAEAWPAECAVRVRMGLHTGPVARAAGGYVGMAVHEAARIANASHGGQIVCSERTADEASLPAGASLRSLGFHRLKDIDNELLIFQLCHNDLADAFPVLRSIASSSGVLPTFASMFIGRTAERVALGSLVRARRLVTIVGPPGVGKTRLAIEVARELAPERRAGARLVELAALDQAAAVGGEVATVLGVREQPQIPIEAAIVHHLESTDACVVIDNCEHLIDAVAALAHRIVTSCPEVRLVLTSREPLEVDGETVWQLAPLEEAPELFVSRAATARPDLALDPNDSIVKEICARIDGLPLAIELAAAQVRRQTIAEIAGDLADRFALLDRTLRGSTKRHATLRAAIDWSYAQLDTSLAELLDRLSVFPGSFDVMAVAAVAAGPDVEAAIGRLVDRSLVARSVEGDHTRYQLLSTIRAVASDRLAASGKHERVAAAHASHYRAAAADVPRSRWAIELVDVVLRDMDDHRAALAWFLDNDPAEGLSHAVDLDVVWTLRLDAGQGVQVLEQFLHAAPKADQALRARAFVILADMHRRQGRFADARKRAETALALDPHAGADRGVLSARLVLAQVLAMQGALAAAEELLEANLKDAEVVGNDAEVVMSRRGLLSLALERGDAGRARVLLDAALADAERLGDTWMRAPLIGDGTKLALLEGRLDDARDLAEGLTVNAQRRGSANSVAETSNNLARVLRHQGSTDQAIELLIEAGRIFEAEGDGGGVAHVLTELGVVFGVCGDLAGAASMLAGAAATRARLGLATPGSEVRDIERTIALARAGIGDEAWAEAWATGERTPPAELLSLMSR